MLLVCGSGLYPVLAKMSPRCFRLQESWQRITNLAQSMLGTSVIITT